MMLYGATKPPSLDAKKTLSRPRACPTAGSYCKLQACFCISEIFVRLCRVCGTPWSCNRPFIGTIGWLVLVSTIYAEDATCFKMALTQRPSTFLTGNHGFLA